jgi:hypothetical protein
MTVSELMSTLKTNEDANLLGHLSIYMIPVGKTLEDGGFCIFKDKLNKITNAARSHLLHLAVDTPAVYAPNPIVEFRIGSGGAAVAPTGNEGGLYNEITPTGNYDKTAITQTFSTNGLMATYTFDLDPSEGNGLTISEVGLFAANYWLNNPAKGKMFNIKTFSEVVKSSAFSLSFVWKINFSGVYQNG